MNQNILVCFEHTMDAITHICLDQHNCKRLLCESCLNCHDFPHQILIPIDNILDQENQDNPFKPGILSQNKNQLICNLQLRAIQFKQIFQQLISDIRENLKCLQNLFKKADQEFKNLLINNKNQDNFSNLGQYNLLKFQENNLFQAWKIFQSNQLNNIKDLQTLLEQQSKEFHHKIKSELNLTKQIQNLSQSAKNQKVIVNQGYQNYCYGGDVWDFQIADFKIFNIGGLDRIVMQEGQILRILSIENRSFQEQITKNLDQMKNVQSDLLQLNKNSKSKQYQQVWKGENFNVGGMVDENNQKIGFWIEFFENFWERTKIINFGFYFEGKKIQKWGVKHVEIEKNDMTDENDEENEKTVQFQNSVNNLSIGGGYYQDDGLKQGKWIDLYQKFSSQNHITYIGEYNHGKKQGKWDIMFKDKLIGGGCYDQQGMKNGKWINHQAKFSKFAQVIYVGRYQNGRKYDQWNAMYREEVSMEFQIVGGGHYNLKGNKDGKWTELPTNYGKNCDGKAIGSYADGKKEGKWEILVDNQIIGGGNYNEDGLKQGIWIDLKENFYFQSQVIYVGGYEKGIKVGNWDTLYRWGSSHEFQRIGGGKYNKSGKKKGKWIDVHKQFWNWMQITFVGGYYKGQKAGKWDIIYEDHFIGGGLYNQDEIKIGRWIDIHENYNKSCLITFQGEYILGQKFGTWKTEIEDQTIGGGDFNSEGKKNGFWIDLHENFNKNCEVIYQGTYYNGIKQGRWDTIYQNKKIGGGQFDEKGKKFGQWIDLDSKFNDSWLGCCKTVYLREYENGILKSVGQKQEII